MVGEYPSPHNYKRFKIRLLYTYLTPDMKPLVQSCL